MTAMPMDCLFSRHSGLPCDMATLILLMTTALFWMGLFLSVRMAAAVREAIS